MSNSKPPIRERLRLALKYFNQGWPAVVPAERKAAPFLWPTWRRGQPQWSIVDVSNYIAEGYELNAIIYSACMYKYRAIASAPLKAYRGTMEDPELLKPEHPLARLVKRPNPWQSWDAFQGTADIYLNVAGNCFIFLDRKQAEVEGIPAAMYTLRPDRVTIIPDPTGKPMVKGYIYIPEGKNWQEGVPILPQDMIHVKLPNPGDTLEGLGWGLSPIAPLAQSADVDNDITRYLKLFFESGAMPAGMLSFDAPISESDAALIRERWNEHYGGVDNWTDPIIMEQGGRYQQLALSFDQMGFEALDARNEARIAAPFGVPIILLETRSALSGSTYANKAEARRMFWEDTMTPELGLFESEYQYYLNPQSGEFVSFDLSMVPALQRNMPELITGVQQLWTMGVPLNVAAATVGLQLADVVEGGDIGYLPINVMPVESAEDMMAARTAPAQIGPGQKPPQQEQEGRGSEGGAPAPEEGEEEERREGKQWSPAAKAQHWKRFDRIAQSWERRFAQAAAQVFEKEKRDILALLTKVKSDAQRQKASISWSTYDEELREYLKQAGEEWRQVFLPLIRGIVEDQGKEWATMLGMQFDVRNLDAEMWFDGYMLEFAQDINQTTKDTLGLMLQQAQREGWSVPQMQKRMTGMFNQWMSGGATAEDFDWYEQRLPPHRTEMIARTESARAANSGSLKIYDSFGAKRKEWLTSIDGRERDAHREANGQVVAIQDAFLVGGERLMYPGDPAGSPELTINCRCTVIPVLPETGILGAAQ